MATITPFPGPHLTPSDHAELARWSAAASAIVGAGYWGDTERTDAGAEYVCVGRGAPPEDAPDVIITPRRGRWDLEEPAGAAMGTFRTLRAALEAICRTLPVAA